MDKFAAGSAVSVTVPLADASGNPFSAAAVQVAVVDENSAVLLAAAPLAGFLAGDETVLVTVPAESNVLAAGVARGLRNLILTVTLDDGNTVVLQTAYVIESSEVLEVGVNSFQTYPHAEFTALSVPNIPGWEAASRDARIAALIEAKTRIVQLNFSQLNSNMNWNQDSLNFLPEGNFSTNYVSAGSSVFLFNGSLELMLPDQFKKLPPKFLNALYLAQIAEADVILGGDPVEARRREGIIQDVIGESRQVFRAGKPLQLPCSRRALSYLSYFVTFAKRIGRNG